MRAIIFDHYGPPQDLRLQEIPKPVPKEREVLVKIVASSVNAADWHLMRADPFLVRLAFGLFRPKIRVLGADIAGHVEAVGSGVARFKPGDAVFGDLSASGWGAFADYACVNEGALHVKPPRATFEQAAATPLAGMTALQALRSGGEARPGRTVLVNGASGGVGTFAVQIARAQGAVVTAVCSPRNVELARSLGADRVLDYTQEDFTGRAERYDLIVAANGYHPLSDYRRALAPMGSYAMVGGTGRQMAEALFLGPMLSMGGDRRLGNVMMKPDAQDLKILADLLEAGALKPVIDRSYSLGQVPEAIAYVESGHAQGKVVIKN
jgi:NADPH:quinone reductase-like Zn-dependent oxidoreductase